jgi:uncharacterized protein YdeI (YjbR/CyaY-like superfamily)
VTRVPGTPAEVTFFDSAADFRRWLEANHETATELWVGHWKKGSGRGGLAYAEGVDEALCFGWIDGKTRRLDEAAYAIRYTPRRRGSNWSVVNIGRIGELTAAGRMHPAGLRAFEARGEVRTGVYSYENRPAHLPEELAEVFRRHPEAWSFFAGQPPSYRRAATWWVVSAKRPETQQRRLAALIERSAAGRRIDALSPP